MNGWGEEEIDRGHRSTNDTSRLLRSQRIRGLTSHVVICGEIIGLLFYRDIDPHYLRVRGSGYF